MTQSESNERKWVFLLCCVAAIHVFIFSAAFPFFNDVDESTHFDLTVKYSHGDIPRGLAPMSAESLRYLVLYHSLEYVETSADFPDGKFPPPLWHLPIEQVAPLLLSRENIVRQNEMNHESSQPPLYYALTGLWWRVGQWCGFKDGRLLYWLRFLNVFIISALVWLGYIAARMIFPKQRFPRFAVPALMAFIPQSAFYSISNDVLSPLCFGTAFICLVFMLRADVPDVRLGIYAGLALAATCLTKMSNLPLITMSTIVVLLKAVHLAKAGKLRIALPFLAALTLCAALPIGLWLAWCKYNFGDITGSEAKIQYLGWTHKPFGEWWHHPIFTPSGFWTFVSDLLTTFWQGEFWWHRQPMTSPVIDEIYATGSLLLLVFALSGLFSRSENITQPQREALCLSLASIIASVSFLAFLSVIYDFHNCANPSREHPYFTSGRLMLGSLIPFLRDYALTKQ
jgi:hypothetical protein